MKFTIPENARMIPLLKPAADAAGRTSRYISIKDAARAIIIVYVDQGNAATILLSLLQATAVAGTGSKALAKVVPIWAALDVATTEVPARATDAVTYTTDAAVKEKAIVFQIDAALLDVNGGFDCIAISTGASNAANITSAFAILVGNRYAGPSGSSALVD
jgi:hypothetical protein